MPGGPQGRKRPADAAGHAVHVAKTATGEIEDAKQPRHADKAKGGRAGGAARKAALMERPTYIPDQAEESGDWSLMASPIAIRDFPFEGGTVRLDPALEFPVAQNRQDDRWEAHGEGLYASVLVHAPDIAGVIDELRADVLPFLWRQYAQEDDTRLSQEARELKADLRRRALG